MSIEKSQLKKKLCETFTEDEIVYLHDTAGDENHYEVSILSDKFKNLSLIEQHQLVYKSLPNMCDGQLHAIKIITKIPEND